MANNNNNNNISTSNLLITTALNHFCDTPFFSLCTPIAMYFFPNVNLCNNDTNNNDSHKKNFIMKSKRKKVF